MAEEASNLFDAVRRANRAVWEQASGRKPSDKSRAIPPPTGRESPLEGADASAMVAVLSAKLSDLQARVDFIEDDFPDTNVPDVGGGGSEYASYFKVIDASDGSTCKIGVTDGRTTVSGSCGTVKINGDRADVTAVEKTLSSDGVYYVWIHSWIDAVDGAQAEIIVGAADDDDPPDNPNGGVAYASQLAGRVTVDDGAITGITQDYLTGGEHTELLFGDCKGEEIQVTP